MKVLHVIPSVSERSGGPATAIVPMCRALMQQGVDVLLLSTSDEAPAGEQVDYKGVPAIFFRSQLGESFKYSRPLAAWLDSNVRHFSVVHIHAVFNHSSVAAAQACRKAAVPYVVRPLGTLDPWSLAQKSLRKRLFWQLTGKHMLSHAAAVHYTSEAEKLSTENHLGLNHGKVIPLGVEANAKNSTAKLEELCPELASEPYLLVLSRLHPKKALDVLIDAFELLLKNQTFAVWRLVLAGDGPADYVAQLHAKVAASKIRDRVIFTGWLDGDTKSAVLNSASLLVLPSYQENFGMCVMEAMSRSVPVMVSPKVNLTDEIASAGAGWIVDIDRNALAEKLAEALSDRDELKRRGSSGKQLSQRFSWENAAKDLVALYREIGKL